MNVIQLEHAEAIVAGAERVGRPVVLQVSENTVSYHGGPAPILAGTLAVAHGAAVDVCVHLDHATSVDLIREAVGLGIGSVMYDGSALDYSANVASTAEVVAWCDDRAVSVEAELGEVGGKDGVHAPGARTDPADAASFVSATGVDALAVAVGSSHAMTTRDAVLDEPLIGRLRDAVPVPLVLHGSSGVPDDGLAPAVAAGITKVNIATTSTPPSPGRSARRSRIPRSWIRASTSAPGGTLSLPRWRGCWPCSAELSGAVRRCRVRRERPRPPPSPGRRPGPGST